MNRIARPVPISFVQFGALTASEWQAYAPVEITRPSNRGNQDPKGTPYDIGLGAMANGSICGTCGLDNSKCPGHFGRIHLEEPVYNPIYIDVVLGIFKSICIWCSAPRISREGAGALLSLDRNKRFKAYKKKAESIKQCYSRTCNKPLPYFFIDKSYIKYYYESKDDNTTISAREAMGILMQITPDTTDLLGFNHALSPNPAFLGEDKDLPQEKHHIHETPPEAFIYAILPVSPTCSRPWVIKGSGKDEERKDDDITDRYNTIIKLNIKLKSDKDTSIEDIPIKGRRKTDKLTDSERIKIKEDLNAAIWSIHDNTSTKDKAKNNSRKHKGLCNRLAGKEGQIQSNIAGKRSDFTARTVIVGGGRYLRLDEIGVPESFTKILTSPEHVLDWNIKALEKLLDEGKINTVYRQGNTIDVKSVTDNGKKPFMWKNQKGLREGDIVHRHLRKGDVGMFNRQPSLRIESIQGVKVFPLKNELVFRVPLGVTRPYNADFDGDECNLHIPQSQGARAECATFSRMAYHIVSAQNNAPVIGCVQNTLVITFILTETFLTPEATDPNQPPNYKFPDGVLGYQTMISKSDFMDAIVQADIPMEHYNNFIVRVAKYYPEYVVKRRGGITLKSFIPGKIVVSIVFPPTFTWSRLTHTNERLPLVEIKDGIIQPNSGPLCSKAIGGKPHSSVHPLWKESPDLAVDFISHLQFMTVIFVTRLGFSIGISDCIATDTTEVKHKLSEASIKCELINSSTKSAADKEIEINGVLNETMSVAPRLAKTGMNKKDRNAVVIMKKAGAKGSDINNGQIAGFVGQQNLDGKRIPQMLSNGRRTLPSIKIGDNSPEAKGFVKHSYLEGLSAQEAWFHAMGGRRGVVDTAMKSVTYETEILITRGASSTPQIIQIGEFIDNLLEEHPENIENHEDRNMELLPLEETIHIPTTDSRGNVTWAPVTAVTRHDPGRALYKITTRGGRSVIVTESKSLLVWDDTTSRLMMIGGDNIRRGDKVPVTLNLPYPPIVHTKVAYTPTKSFEFDKLNGYFVGLYLAGGYSNKHGGVTIINNDSKLFRWLEKYDIKWYGSPVFGSAVNRIDVKTTSTIIKTFSSPLITFLISWLGKDKQTKKIPDELYSAPKDFIYELVKEYGSSGGSIGLGKVIIDDPLYNLDSRISILCSRVGVCNERYTVPIENDIILDVVENIELVDVTKHPHVYDLTVPSTTVFGLANGLHVVDTAHSGYIQKRSVNAVNNFKVNHDATVRDSNGGIVQFTYGGDGLNGKERIFCEEVGKYLFVNPIHIAGSLNSKAEADSNYQKSNVKRTMLKEEVDELLKNIIFTCAGKETEITKRVTYNTRVCLRQAISSIKLYECIIPDFCFRIRNEYEQAKVKNGYMAGLVASSSIGEPTTQLSQLKDEKIPLMVKRKDGQIEYLLDPIGEAIDGLFEECPILFELGPNSIAGYPDVEVYVHTVDPDTSKTEWKRVQEISRHPASGKLIEVTTKSGRKTTTTLSHSHLRLSDNGVIVPIRGDQLQIGDTIPVCGKLHALVTIDMVTIEGVKYPLDMYFGGMVGTYLFGGDEDIPREIKKYLTEICGLTDRHIPAFSLFAPDNFILGILRESLIKRDKPIIFTKDLVEGLALLYARFGIFSNLNRGIEAEKRDRLKRIEDIVWDPIISLTILDDPKTLVYDLGVAGNHTFMMQSGIFTHNTLNSVDWETPIFVRMENDTLGITEGGMIVAPIGQIIDKIIDEAHIVYQCENETECVDIYDMKATVTCVDEDGKMHWKPLESVTRHLPGGKLVHIKTRSGREVKATKAKSFLVRENNKIVGKLGSEIKIGDHVPLVRQAPPIKDPLTVMSMECYLPKNEYIYGSEMEKMRRYRAAHNKKADCWWSRGNNTEFIAPYSRGDSASEGLKKGYIDGAIYPIHSGHVVGRFPEIFQLDRLTGFLFGAYLAEGCVTDMYTSIANNDQAYLKRISDWCDQYNIGWHITVHHDKNFIGSTSTDIRIHSNLLAKVLNITCGKGSPNKHIPPWSLVACDEFVEGLLDGYVSGDGCVDLQSGAIICASVSKILLDGISELCSRFGMFGQIRSVQQKKNNIGSQNILRCYNYNLCNGFAQIFASTISLVIDYKQERLNKTLERSYQRTGGRFDVIPGVNIGDLNGCYHRDDLQDYLPSIKNVTHRNEIEKAVNDDVYYDEIIFLEEVESSRTKVYDLTVKDTRNFNILGGLCQADTFHNAGNSAKDVTLGVPRLTEILNATKKPSKPSCIVYLEDQELKDNLEVRRQLQADIKNAGVEGEEVEGLKKEVEALDKKSLYKITKLGSNLTHYTVEHFIKEHELRYLSIGEGQPSAIGSPLGLLTYEEYEPKWWVKLASDLGNAPKFKPQSWVILLHLNMDNLYTAQITVEDIAIKIEEHSFGQRGYAMTCVASPNVCGQIEVYINFAECAKYIESQIELPRGDDSSDEEDESSDRHLVTSDNIDYFVARDVAMSIIKNTPVQGIDGITRCYVRQEVASGEWVVDTQGSNLMELLGTPGIDATRTISDNMWEILRVLGIEATRTFLSPEIIKILSFDGTYVDGRHPQLMADSMLRSGTITGVNRDGIPRDVGPIAKGMFEKPIENLAEASAFGEHDKVKGVHSSVMFGTLAEVGSGTVDIKDSERLPIKKKIIKGGKGT